jgi:hypothetical protein
MNMRPRDFEKQRGKYCLIPLAASVLLLGPVVCAQAGDKGNPNPGVLPIQSNCYGMSYGEWQAAWWQWIASIPSDANPLLDKTGQNAAQGQSDQVWFLAGTWATPSAPPIVRTVTVPAGKALFFPVINQLWIGFKSDPAWDQPYDPGSGDVYETYEEYVRDLLADMIDAMIVPQNPPSCEIDGREVRDIAAYRGESTTFSIAPPADDIFGLSAYEGESWPDGTWHPCADDGIYLMLAPLSAGKHTIHIVIPGFLDVTYQITVKRVGAKPAE